MVVSGGSTVYRKCFYSFAVTFATTIATALRMLLFRFVLHDLKAPKHIACGPERHCPLNTTIIFPFAVHNCDDIRVIESCFLAILIMSAFGAIMTLSGSIIGCMGTCCAKPAVSHVISE